MQLIFFEFKKLYRSRIVQILCLCLLLTAILDPISVLLQDIFSGGKLLLYAGKNPFQFWLLMNSVNWGNNLYNTLFLAISVLITGLVFYSEKHSSLLGLQIIRARKIRFLCGKIISHFLFPFIIILCILSINTIVTYLVFQDRSTFSEYYNHLVPHVGTFAYSLYNKSTYLLIFVYILLNAITISLFSLFALGLYMIFNFRNKYIAMIVPVFILYIISFVTDAFPQLHHYNIRLIIQPRTSASLIEILSTKDVFTTIFIWLSVVSILLIIGCFRNKDVFL